MSTPRTPGAPIALDLSSLERVSGGFDRPGRDGSPPPEPGKEINGSDQADWISGGRGDDTINAGAGDDYVSGGLGADQIDLGAGNDRMNWSPYAGNDTVLGGDGMDTLILQGYDISLEDLLAAIQPDPGSPAPYMNEDGMIVLDGVSGTITIGDSTLTFSGFERIFVNA